MYIDRQNKFSIAQALTATAVSTDVIDLGADRNIGIGEPMAVVLNVDVAAGGTSPTLVFAIQADDNVGFSSAATIASSATLTGAQLVAGAQFVLPVPPDLTTERFIRVNYTVGGTSPTVTVSCQLQPMNMIQNYVSYPDGFTIS
jgi:hypothetical protein